MPESVRVTFVLLDQEPLAQLMLLDPDRDWQQFVTGERAWILQTCLRLKAAGAPVAMADRLPDHGIAVFSSKQRRALRAVTPTTAAILVGVRADVGEALLADFEVLQNGQHADGVRYFIPHWPQPGLKPRAFDRGDTLRSIAYKGYSGNLHPDFLGEDWLRFVRLHALEWHADAVAYDGADTQREALSWNDFSNVDLILAVRPPDAAMYPRKPATKLYNAWHAGVPALLGPELAYRELRRSELDYIEVDGRATAEAAVRSLLASPGAYRAMIENGRRRAQEFTAAAILAHWQRLLFEEIPRQSQAPHVRRWRGKPLWLKVGCRRLARLARMRT